MLTIVPQEADYATSQNNNRPVEPSNENQLKKSKSEGDVELARVAIHGTQSHQPSRSTFFEYTPLIQPAVGSRVHNPFVDLVSFYKNDTWGLSFLGLILVVSLLLLAGLIAFTVQFAAKIDVSPPDKTIWEKVILANNFCPPL